MATVSGRVLFDASRNMNISALPGIRNVPIVLQNRAEPHQGLAVFTNDNGEYIFHNVPQGEYRIVESYDEQAVPSPGDFNNAIPGAIKAATVPPISYAPNPPVGATNLDCLTPSTLFLWVDTVNRSEQNFLNGPVKHIPINTMIDSCATILSENLIADADFGTMGTFPAGTVENTGVATEPYPENVPDLAYILPLTHPVVYPGYPPWFHAPEDGEYTIQNIINDDNSNRIGAWWRIADHTTGNETGRFMLVNGHAPDSVFFTEEVAVKLNTYYLFSAWILNMFRATGWADPKLGVKILDENGRELYKATLGELIPVNTVVPEWKQIGTTLNSQNNAKLTVAFYSEGQAAIGNDYAIDDIELHEINVPVFIPVKSIDRPVAFVGEIVVYKVALENTCSFPLSNIKFVDKLPQGLEFVPNSVFVNGVQMPSVNPEAGFPLPNLASGEKVVVQFEALALHSQDTPVINVAEMQYDYAPVEGGITKTYDVESNEVLLEIKEGDVDVKLLMTKIVIGASLAGGEFTFGIFDPGGVELYTATNDVTGLITFPDIKFSQTGEFNYTVKEIDAPPDWETDTTIWPIKIVVTNVQGELRAVVAYPDGVPTFVNTLRGATCGEFQFPDLTFDKPGIYEHTLRELTPSGDGWTTDDKVIRLIVTVVDDGHGNLVATIEYPDGFPSFINIYKVKPTRIIISGCKAAIGAPLPSGRFMFGLYDSEGNLISTATNAAAGESVPGNKGRCCG